MFAGSFSRGFVTSRRKILQRGWFLKNLTSLFCSMVRSWFSCTRICFTVLTRRSILAEKTRAMQELWEFNADYRVILSRAFSSLLYDKIDSLDTKRAFDPPVSLCVSPDFRLLTICARLLQATLDKSQGYRVAEINIGELDSNPSSEVFWSTGGSASKSVHVSILAQEFQEYGQPRVWFSCLFDDTTMLAATLRRASQFAFHLRCKPSISPLKTQLWDDTEAWIIPKHATTLNIDTRNVYSASTNSANSIHTSQSIRASTSKPIYVRIFSFEATLGVGEYSALYFIIICCSSFFI